MAFLVLDAGTGSGKCAIFDRGGKLLGAHGESWTYDVRPNPELPLVKESSFDPTKFWDVLCRCARAALADANIAPRDIEGIATTSQREGCVFLDPHGKEVYAGPNIDARGFSEGLEVLNVLGRERLYRITGHSVPFIFPLARYLWYRKHGGSTVDRLLMINDWMAYRLTGEFASEPSNATESMLFDLEAQCWSEEILSTFEIEPSLLPPILANGTRMGSVTGAAAQVTGLLAGTPVHVGGADTQCSLLGAGVLESDVLAATLGTTTPVQIVTPQAVFDPECNLWAGCHVVPDRWVLESNAGDTGDAFLWLLELIGGGLPRAQRFALADQLASAPLHAPPAMLFVGPTIFNLARMNMMRPAGVLFPYPSMHERPDRAALVRGFMDNVGYAIRGNLEQLTAAVGERVSRFVVSGGMTRSRALLQTIADITGLVLDVAREPESAALGCAILMAAEGDRATLSQVAGEMVRHTQIHPATDSRQHYESGYARWRELDNLLDQAVL